jgi:cytochrome c553
VALKAYRDGERDHKTMDLQAQALSDQDIEDVAAYFASLGGE